MAKETPDLLEKVVSLCKRRGFVFPGSEIYGGLANSWDYGPLGVELKNNIKKLWWQMFVTERDDMVGIDAALIMNPRVWQASGHVGGFSDPLVECKQCHTRLRADQSADNTCPVCGSHEFTEQKDFNMMFKTNLGPVEDDTSTVYLRPETAQAMFVDFKQIAETTRLKLPFGVAQVGKAFRNEITPGNFIFRTREFDLMELEYFVKPEEWEKHFEHWLVEVKRWVKAVGIDESRVEYVEIAEGDRAHYSKRTIDVEFKYPFGQKELYGLAYRGDFDLKAHQEASGQDLTYRDPQTNETFLPHVIEPAFGADRTLLAVLLSAYTETEARSGEEDTKHETEVTLRLPKALAPIKVAVLPLSKKEELSGPAHALALELKRHFVCQYDETGSIGKRYRRQDEIGTPYCVTYDFDTLTDHCVTVRDRDTMAQERVPLADLAAYLTTHLNS